jgi:two-component system response regulator AdeR
VAVVLRRTRPAADTPRLTFGPLTIDLDATRAVVSGAEVPLTATEYRLLTCLATHAGRTLSRAQLRAAALPDSAALDRVVDAHLTNLRRKLAAADPRTGELIETVRGFGYRLTTADRR